MGGAGAAIRRKSLEAGLREYIERLSRKTILSRAAIRRKGGPFGCGWGPSPPTPHHNDTICCHAAPPPACLPPRSPTTCLPSRGANTPHTALHVGKPRDHVGKLCGHVGSLLVTYISYVITWACLLIMRQPRDHVIESVGHVVKSIGHVGASPTFPPRGASRRGAGRAWRRRWSGCWRARAPHPPTCSSGPTSPPPGPAPAPARPPRTRAPARPPRPKGVTRFRRGVAWRPMRPAHGAGRVRAGH